MALIALAGPALAQHALPVGPGGCSGRERTPVIPGAHMATLAGDSPMLEIIIQRFKFPNHRVSPHMHIFNQAATVLSGTLGFGEGEKFDTGKGVILKAGSEFALNSGQQHFDWTTSEETVVQVVFTGPPIFSNPAHEPRKK